MNEKTVEQNILEIIKNEPACAEDDRLLITRYWQMKGLDLDYDQIQTILKLTTPETITRARRKLQQDGRVRPTLETLRRREARERIYRQTMGKKTPITQTTEFMQTSML